MGVSIDASKIIDWANKAISYFRPFRPETKSITINYRDRSAEIDVVIHITDPIRKKINVIEIPAYNNFRIVRVIDESFSPITGGWTLENGIWKAWPEKLRTGEKFLVTMQGKVDEQYIRDFVRIQPASNRDQTEELDRYWLNSMIRKVDVLEQLWKNLEVDEVNVGVNIAIDRIFAAKIPRQLADISEAATQYMKEGYGTDRNAQFEAWTRLRHISKDVKIDYLDVVSLIKKMTKTDIFSNYVSADNPYYIGTIEKIESSSGIIPQKMTVEALTKLSLKSPIATGNLIFKKKEYGKMIEDEFTKMR
jgi:hypothetical protein